MNDSGISPKKRRKLKVSHVLIILLLVCAGLFAYYRLSLKSKLQARINAIVAEGYPVTCTDLDQWYKIPPNVENAAYTIIDAFSFYKKWDKEKSEPLPVVGRAKLPARTEPMDEEMKALITQYVTDNNEALKLLHAGAAIGHSRYPIDLSAGFETMMPELSEIRTAVFLLKLEAILHTENGDGKLAIRSIKSILGIARSRTKVPATNSQLALCAYQSLASSTIEYCIKRIELTDEQLVELIEYIQDSERISDMSCAYIGERCVGLSFFKAPGSVNPDFINGIPSRLLLELYKATGMTDADAIIFLDLMDEYIKSAQLPPFERLNAARAIEAKLKSTSQAHILLHIIALPYSTITTIDTRNIARLYITMVALAIERYRLAAGKLPDELADIVPAYLDSVPKDPFDGNELRYRKLQPGYVVYSIGEDLSDDGGKEKPPRKTKESPNWDLTFIVER